MSDEVRFIDTTLRDGNQSLWALNMKIGAMLPALPHMDQAGFESMEFFLSVIFKKYVREHKENPWYWLQRRHQTDQKNPPALSRRHAQRLRKNTPLHSQAAGRTARLLRTDLNPHVQLLERLHAPSRKRSTISKKTGMDTVANLIYSVSPRHTDEYYARKARKRRPSSPGAFASKTSAGCSRRSAREL